MSRLIYYFPLIFLFVSLILILLIKPRKDHYYEEKYLSTLPFRLVIAAYVTTVFVFVEFFKDAPVTFAALLTFLLPPGFFFQVQEQPLHSEHANFVKHPCCWQAFISSSPV